MKQKMPINFLPNRKKRIEILFIIKNNLIIMGLSFISPCKSDKL
ncbi:hypothetical protein HMPREF1051_3134 [Neisseria sicca VK64]|uniref:Uncharacterized protein n=1 Tax=Neisseria sicca VK64 TaxID=1095748 RepID=I2NVE8_NEISI|nr:hypothetical protein HMPREF1051_3134 [Neisseria sicca VK64]